MALRLGGAMALRSVLCCRAALARAQILAPSSSSIACRSPIGTSSARASPTSFKIRCLSSSSSAPSSLSVEEAPSPASPHAVPERTDAEAPDPSADLDALDIRVGRIIKAWKHPEADSLYVEEVDLGEPDGPRTICSGLVKYISQEEIQERNVMVLANLKPRNMRGVKSNGMLLAASDASHENVELLTPSDGSVPGERAWFGLETDKESQADAATPNQLQKKKIWEGIQPHLRTSEECVATFKERPMRTSAGLVTCKSLKGANVA